MLGEQIGVTTGKRLVRRVLSTDPPTAEVSFEDSGTLCGVAVTGLGHIHVGYRCRRISSRRRPGKGKEAKLSYSGNLLVENRNGLIVNAELLEANGRAERDAALVMLEQIPEKGRITVGGDKGFDTQEFIEECRRTNGTPHVAQNDGRRGGSAIDARTTRHAGYPESQKKRKRIEECFGWLKDIALLSKLKHRGILKVGWIFTFAAAAYNLVRLKKLIPIQSVA